MEPLEKDFLEILSQYNAMLHKICRLYRDHAEDREDLFQEIVFQLWKSYPDYKGDSKVSTWMYRIALNTALASFRKKTTTINYRTQLPDFAEESPSDEAAIRQERLFAVVKVLNDSEKALIALYFEELSYQQIAEITGINENYVGVKLNRIKTKIKTLLNK
ncbi:RNA polymerase sigma-70 factor, ECF subfamily [Flavobacterium flevense]|uniref:DNA-directed RNA polymerase sigma-70 factor n=1 Tax=Flavobacterium flevense TaxID=983 RepID=A0A4Y4AXB3_9FLAO|nr:sigma-70 family RNA polymerase sigma factor [Flavobacterium flevense]GEC72871.1 DNA-directed RNA polymerase sigma-70 factor [Flavobacterium flevense]SHL87748.1 RNA polymerase sigma-70 factor, ECF subfamily [Flavobacterium flevense]